MRLVKFGQFVGFLLVLACSSNDPAPTLTVLDYYPLKKGAYQIFAVDSTVISKNTYYVLLSTESASG
jgi:hypothetical protein